MEKSISIDQLANASARAAQSQAAQASRDLRALRDAVSRLAIRAPVIKTPRGKTKKTTSQPSLFGVSLSTAETFGAAGLSVTGLASGSFYSSAAQQAGSQLADLALGQRIR